MKDLEVGVMVTVNAPGMIAGTEAGDKRQYQVISVNKDEDFVTVGWDGVVHVAGKLDDFKVVDHQTEMGESLVSTSDAKDRTENLVNIPSDDFHLALDGTNLPTGKAIDDVTEVKASTDNMHVVASFNDGSTRILKHGGEPTFAKQAAKPSHSRDNSPSM